jgi:adenine/guanine phosphoribosyltransferase-like PRPP-binding protein
MGKTGKAFRHLYQEFYELWEKEAQSVIAGLKARAIKTAYKVPEKSEAIAREKRSLKATKIAGLVTCQLLDQLQVELFHITQNDLCASFK